MRRLYRAGVGREPRHGAALPALDERSPPPRESSPPSPSSTWPPSRWWEGAKAKGEAEGEDGGGAVGSEEGGLGVVEDGEEERRRPSHAPRKHFGVYVAAHPRRPAWPRRGGALRPQRGARLVLERPFFGPSDLASSAWRPGLLGGLLDPRLHLLLPVEDSPIPSGTRPDRTMSRMKVRSEGKADAAADVLVRDGRPESLSPSNHLRISFLSYSIPSSAMTGSTGSSLVMGAPGSPPHPPCLCHSNGENDIGYGRAMVLGMGRYREPRVENFLWNRIGKRELEMSKATKSKRTSKGKRGNPNPNPTDVRKRLTRTLMHILSFIGDDDCESMHRFLSTLRKGAWKEVAEHLGWRGVKTRGRSTRRRPPAAMRGWQYPTQRGASRSCTLDRRGKVPISRRNGSTRTSGRPASPSPMEMASIHTFTKFRQKGRRWCIWQPDGRSDRKAYMLTDVRYEVHGQSRSEHYFALLLALLLKRTHAAPIRRRRRTLKRRTRPLDRLSCGFGA